MLLHSYEANDNPPRTSKDVQMQRDMETILQLAIGSITIYTCTHAILTTSRQLGQFKSANNPDILNCSVDVNAIFANK